MRRLTTVSSDAGDIVHEIEVSDAAFALLIEKAETHPARLRLTKEHKEFRAAKVRELQTALSQLDR